MMPAYGAMSTVSQRELEGRLWDAANSLRGPVDPADFKAYVFPLLFFKWISDTWDWEHAQAVADFGPDVTPEEEAGYHRFDIPDGCHWSDLQTTTTNVGVKLRNILDALDWRTRRSWPGSSATSPGATRSGSRSRHCSTSSTPSIA